MRGKFKKFVVYLLATAIITPGWILGSSLFSKPSSVYAATVQSVYDNGTAAYNENTPANWSSVALGINGNSRVTDGTHNGEFAKWDFSPSVAGQYTVYMSWVVNSAHTPNAEYSVFDKNGLNPAIRVNQREDSVGTVQANGTPSGYKNIGTYEFNASGSYYIKLDAYNISGSISADAIKIYHANIKPIASSLSNPANNSAIANDMPTFSWTAITDSEGDGITYDLIVDNDVDLSSPVIEQNGLATNSYTSTLSLTNGIYYWVVRSYDGEDYSVFTAKSNFCVDTIAPTVPTNPLVLISGKSIQVSWTASTDAGSGVAGYNIYRNSDSYISKLNSQIITGASYTDFPNVDGDYNYKVEAVDNAYNASDKSNISNTVHLDITAPSAPTGITTTVSDHTLKITWDAVGGGIGGYIVTINDVSRDVGNVTQYSTDLNYGTYKVLVTSYYSADNFGINDSVGLNQAKNQAIAAGLEKSITLASTVKTATVRQVSVAPESVQVTPTTVEQPAVEQPIVTEQPTDEGQIKGEENTTQEESNDKINWTPWIILFILILLAGAATGGYFYWFAGDEEVQTVVKSKPEADKKSAPVTKTKGSNKKPRRW